ncbi:NADAR family protein [bacterium]|nr:NADAR family protein [bacterium]
MSHPQEPSVKGQVYFYPPEYYVFSNFSSFQIEYKGKMYPTSEHAYQSFKFINSEPGLAERIRNAKSAHEAFKMGEANFDKRQKDWDIIKFDIMKEILICKVNQHEYVKKKLLQSGSREIVEDSWKDSCWGWGEDRQGENHLGKLWVEIREKFQK